MINKKKILFVVIALIGGVLVYFLVKSKKPKHEILNEVYPLDKDTELNNARNTVYVSAPTPPKSYPERVYIGDEKPSKGTYLWINTDVEVVDVLKHAGGKSRKYSHHTEDYGFGLGKSLKRDGNFIKVEGAGDQSGWIRISDYPDKIYWRRNK